MIKLWVPVLYIFISMSGIECRKCPDYSVQQNFNASQYLGKWYQHGSINTETFQGKGKCIFAIYGTTADSSVISVHNEQIKLSTNKVDSIDGTAKLVDASSGEGKLTVTFPIWWFKVNGPYWVLSTDYTNYAIVYGCQTYFWVFHSASYWILTRQQVADQSTLDKVKAALAMHNLNYSDFQLTNQSDCNA